MFTVLKLRITWCLLRQLFLGELLFRACSVLVPYTIGTGWALLETRVVCALDVYLAISVPHAIRIHSTAGEHDKKYSGDRNDASVAPNQNRTSCCPPFDFC